MSAISANVGGDRQLIEPYTCEYELPNHVVFREAGRTWCEDSSTAARPRRSVIERVRL